MRCEVLMMMNSRACGRAPVVRRASRESARRNVARPPRRLHTRGNTGCVHISYIIDLVQMSGIHNKTHFMHKQPCEQIVQVPCNLVGNCRDIFSTNQNEADLLAVNIISIWLIMYYIYFIPHYCLFVLFCIMMFY